MVLVACGGGGSETHLEHPTPSASASSTTPPPAPMSVVHFDDLGLTFAVPTGYHVIGDAELAARITATADAHLQADLRSRAEAKKGLPLLALSKDDLNVTLSVVVVPADALPMELAVHQQQVMSANLQAFEVTSPPKDHTTDGVGGAEMQTRYVLDNRKVSSTMRLYVRNGLATLVTAVWPEQFQRAAEAATLLDGLHFQALVVPSRP